MDHGSKKVTMFSYTFSLSPAATGDERLFGYLGERAYIGDLKPISIAFTKQLPSCTATGNPITSIHAIGIERPRETRSPAGVNVGTDPGDIVQPVIECDIQLREDPCSFELFECGRKAWPGRDHVIHKNTQEYRRIRVKDKREVFIKAREQGTSLS
jgi:hypothetical protein